jgi:histidinol dehydrogenase
MMRILDWNTLDKLARRLALTRPQHQVRAEVTRAACELIERVREEGDTALRALTRRFDGVGIKSIAVDRNEFGEARRSLNGPQLAALRRAIRNVERFHELQLPKPRVVEVENGVRCEELIRPLARVGLYVPGGSAPLVSTVIMLAVPARIAGCAQCVLCTPPGRDGSVHPALLVAAQLCGISSVFRVGGAQAIAALAYGTESIPKVDKVFGPGNAWVAAAKALVASDPAGAACDLPAGPSEVLIVADETARPEFVAADLLAQAEHDGLAQAILVTDSRYFAEGVAREIRRQRPGLTRGEILTQSLDASRAIVVADLDTALQVANEYAPEHLLLQVREPRRWLAHVQNAGAVFLGPWSPEPLGDYCSGTNHVLPTYGYARTSSGLSVRDFVKTLTVQEVSSEGLAALGPTAVTLAELEGLDAHASAVTRRLAVLGAEGRASAFTGKRAPASVGAR